MWQADDTNFCTLAVYMIVSPRIVSPRTCTPMTVNDINSKPNLVLILDIIFERVSMGYSPSQETANNMPFSQ